MMINNDTGDINISASRHFWMNAYGTIIVKQGEIATWKLEVMEYSPYTLFGTSEVKIRMNYKIHKSHFVTRNAFYSYFGYKYTNSSYSRVKEPYAEK